MTYNLFKFPNNAFTFRIAVFASIFVTSDLKRLYISIEFDSSIFSSLIDKYDISRVSKSSNKSSDAKSTNFDCFISLSISIAFLYNFLKLTNNIAYLTVIDFITLSFSIDKL